MYRNNTRRPPVRVVFREAPDPLARGMVGGISPIGRRDFGSSDESLVGPIHKVVNTPWGPQHQTVLRTPSTPRKHSHRHSKIDPPPAYEKVTGSGRLAPRVSAREMPFSATPDLQLPPHFKTNNPRVSRLIEGLGEAMAAYRAGSVRHRDVRKVLKALKNELYEEEIARRESQRGRVGCGERYQIWKEVRAIDFGF